MNDDDLIRRGDAIKSVDDWQGDWSCTVLALSALTAVQPRVKPLVWLQHPHRLGELFADAEFGAYSVSDPTGRGCWQWQWHFRGALLGQSNQALARAFPTREDAIAAVEGHRKARILSALDLPAPKPDPFFTLPPAEPQPDAAAIREAALSLPDYDAGLLNDWGGGNVEWWQDYIRTEIGRANDYWRDATLALIDTGKGTK
jgi:hypothetical protein